MPEAAPPAAPAQSPTSQKPPSSPQPNGTDHSDEDEEFFTPVPPKSSVDDDFDFDEFRPKDTDSFESADPEGVSDVLIRHPKRTETVYFHQTWKETAYLLLPEELDEHEVYLVHPTIAARYPDICRKYLLYPFADTENNFFFCQVAQEDQSGRIHKASISLESRIRQSFGRWCQIAYGGKKLGTYKLYWAKGDRKAPKWPEGGLKLLRDQAFRDRRIGRDDFDNSLLTNKQGRDADQSHAQG